MAKLKTEQEQINKLTSEQENVSAYKATDEEMAIIVKVTERYKSMRYSEERNEVETDWDNADKAYRAYTSSVDSDDTRSNINKPIPFAVIETEIQETIERRTRPLLEPRQYSDLAGTDLANEVLKYSFDKGDFDYQYYLAKKEALTYGTGILWEYYREDKRTVKELKIVRDEQGEKEEYENVERTDFDDCYAEYIPLRQMFFDPAANHISKCRDLIRREILHIEEFKRIYGKKRGFKNVEYVVSGGDTHIESFYEVPKDVLEGHQVEVLHYYNRALDEYHVVANLVLIRQGPNPYPHKELPAVPLYCYKIPNKFYGLGIPKIVQSLVDERNTLSNLRLDYQKMGISKMFFYDDMVELDEIDLITRQGGGVPINTQGRPIDQVIRWIEYGDVKPSTFREEDILIEDVRRTTGVDDRIQGLNVGGTATEAAILKESTMKRINAKMILMEIDSLIRLGRLRMANIAFFYSIPKIKRITAKNGEEKYQKTERTVRIKDKKYEIDEKGALSAVKIEGYSFIKINKKVSKYLEGEFDFVINTQGGVPISKPLKQAKITEMFDRLTSHPAFIREIDPRKALNRYIVINEEDPEDWLKKDISEQEDLEALAEAENVMMLRGTPIPPTKDANEEHTKVHLAETRSREFEESPPEIQEILEAHIKGESAEMGADVGEEGAEEGTPDITSQLPSPKINPADITPNFRGQE